MITIFLKVKTTLVRVSIFSSTLERMENKSGEKKKNRIGRWLYNTIVVVSQTMCPRARVCEAVVLVRWCVAAEACEWLRRRLACWSTPFISRRDETGWWFAWRAFCGFYPLGFFKKNFNHSSPSHLSFTFFLSE